MSGQQAAQAEERRASAGIHRARQTVRDRIAQSQRAQWEARKASQAGGGFTRRPSEFRWLILPRLAGIPPVTLAYTTGLSAGTAFRSGRGSACRTSGDGGRCNLPASSTKAT